MLPAPTVEVKCALCGVSVNPLVSRYLTCVLGWRGRPVPRPLVRSGVQYCGPCGDLIIRQLTPFLSRQQADGLARRY